MSIRVAVVAALAAGVGSISVASAAVDINGGQSWGGWTSRGMSTDVGVYGRGSATAVYEVYSTVFTFNSDPITGSPTMAGAPSPSGFAAGTYSTGAFTNGNTILGLGVRTVSGGTISSPTVKFDLGNDTFAPASTLGGSDGRTSFSQYQQTGDFTAQFDSASSWRPSNITVATSNGLNALVGSGPATTVQLPGGVGSGTSYDFAFRAFAQVPANTYQMFFDLTAMQSLYGAGGPGGLFPSFPGIGTIGNDFRVAIAGLSTNEVTFGVNVPAPASAALLGLGGLLATRRRRVMRS